MTRARVRVPATTADLGVGRDRIGIAVDRWLTVSADLEGTRGVTIERAGTLTSLDLPPWRDLLHIGFGGACWAACRAVPTNIRFTATSDIPIGCGLGASAAAVVAGVLLANAMLSLGLDASTMLSVAADIAERADRVAAALHGGACLLLPPLPSAGERAPVVAPVNVHADLALVFAVPDHTGRTDGPPGTRWDDTDGELAADAASHARVRAAELIDGIARGRVDLLEGWREHASSPGASDAGRDAVRRAAERAGAIGATWSGSGSSVVAISPATCADAVATAMVESWGAHGVRATRFVSAGTVSAAHVASRSSSSHDRRARDIRDAHDVGVPPDSSVM